MLNYGGEKKETTHGLRRKIKIMSLLVAYVSSSMSPFYHHTSKALAVKLFSCTVNCLQPLLLSHHIALNPLSSSSHLNCTKCYGLLLSFCVVPRGEEDRIAYSLMDRR